MSEDLIIDIFKNFDNEFNDFKKNQKGGLIEEFFKQKNSPNPKHFPIPDSKHEAIGFSKGKRIEGPCIIYFKTNDYFIGNFKGNKKNGFGFHHYTNGFIFKGNYKDDTKADGIVFDPKNKMIIYEGGWEKDVYNGQGKLTKPNSATYIGMFAGGRFNGEGEIKFVNGGTYTGDFVEGKREGKGKFDFASGDTYEGNFIGNKFNGQGVYTWKNGDTFNGIFDNGSITGEGEMSYRELGVLGSGIWDNKEKPKGVDFNLETGTNKDLY
jgi:hypothetical protein